jgi:hypothetical protein
LVSLLKGIPIGKEGDHTDLVEIAGSSSALITKAINAPDAQGLGRKILSSAGSTPTIHVRKWPCLRGSAILLHTTQGNPLQKQLVVCSEDIGVAYLPQNVQAG